MRRLISTILALVLVAGIFMPETLRANEISVTIDGVAVDFEGQPPTIVDGRTLVPVRGVFEALGFEVDWDQDVQMATLTRDDFVVRIIIGQPTFGIDDYVNEATGNVELDVPAQIIDGRTMLPIRAVLEAVGYYVDWDDAWRRVRISSAPTVIIGGERFGVASTVLELGFMDLQNEDLLVLRYMENLTELWLSGNYISDLSPLAGLTNLTSLAVGWSEIGLSDLTPLAGLTNLTMLNLGGNQISDLSPLAGLTNLEQLFLHSNQISDISPLAGLTNLEILWLEDSEVSDLAPLSGLVNLTELNLDRSQVTDLSPLAELVNLQELSLTGNQISDITALANLTNLTVLRLWMSQVTDITALAGHVNFEILNLSGNQISDISPLASLPYSTSLLLFGNPITDWSPVEHVEDVDGRP